MLLLSFPRPDDNLRAVETVKEVNDLLLMSVYD